MLGTVRPEAACSKAAFMIVLAQTSRCASRRLETHSLLSPPGGGLDVARVRVLGNVGKGRCQLCHIGDLAEVFLEEVYPRSALLCGESVIARIELFLLYAAWGRRVWAVVALSMLPGCQAAGSCR